MNKKWVIASAILFFLVFAGFASASSGVSVVNYSIQTDYAPNSYIVGSINLSLNNIPMNSTVVTPYGNITLSDLISRQTGFSKTCSPKGCLATYNIIPGTINFSKVVTVGKGKNYTIGLIIPSKVGKILNINSGFAVNVSSNASSSVSQQLFLDLIADNSIEWQPFQSSGEFSARYFGCFSSYATTLDNASLSTNKYCEVINLSKSPNVIIGANSLYPQSAGSSATVKLWIKRNGESYWGDCTNTTDSAGEVSCIPQYDGAQITGNYQVSVTGSYYVCISQPQSSDPDFIIKEETSPTICGFVGEPSSNPPNPYKVDFPLFARTGVYSQIGKITLDDASSSLALNQKKNLEQYINDTLKSQYDMDCSNGCVIPLKLISNQTQKINVSGFVIGSYTDSNNLDRYISPSDGKVAAVTSAPALVSAQKQNLSLSVANFTVPQDFGDQNFYVKIYNGTKMISVISKKITIEKIPQVSSVSPMVTAAEISTPFSVKVETFGAPANITQYKWDFGDGSKVVTTTQNNVTHTYANISSFQLEVTIQNSLGQSSSKNVTINVTSPKDAANKLLAQYSENGANIQKYFDSLSGFTKSSLENLLNWNYTQFVINYATEKNTTANTDADYLDMMKKLLTIDVPNSVQQTAVANSIAFVPDSNNIDLQALKQITNSNYDSSQEGAYKNSLISWIINNAHITEDYSEYSEVKSSSETVPLLDVVSLNVNLNSSSGKAYLLIPKLDNFNSSTNYSTEGNYIYFEIPSGSQEQITFSTTQSVIPTQIPIMISPALSSITPEQEAASTKKTFNWILFGGVLIAIIFFGIIIYVILGKWYEKRYENYLFKNKNDLYNVVTYIHSAKIRGVRDDEIERNLRRSRWSNEQVNYIMKRYVGKKVGLPGFTKKYVKKK